MATVRMQDKNNEKGYRNVRAYRVFTWLLLDVNREIPVAVVANPDSGNMLQVMDIRSGRRIGPFYYMGAWSGGWPVDKEGMMGDAYRVLIKIREKMTDQCILDILDNADALPTD